MSTFRQTIPIDDYVVDVLMRDIVGHDQQPAAFLVYLYLYGQAARKKWKLVAASLRMLADATGLSKSAVQIALANLPLMEYFSFRQSIEPRRPREESILTHRRKTEAAAARHIRSLVLLSTACR